MLIIYWYNTVGGRNPAPVDMKLIQLLTGFLHPWWCRIFSINSSIILIASVQRTKIKVDTHNTLLILWGIHTHYIPLRYLPGRHHTTTQQAPRFPAPMTQQSMSLIWRSAKCSGNPEISSLSFGIQSPKQRMGAWNRNTPCVWFRWLDTLCSSSENMTIDS